MEIRRLEGDDKTGVVEEGAIRDESARGTVLVDRCESC